MTDNISCEDFTEAAVVERYVAGTLLDSELEDFEAHLLLCPRCQERIAEAVAIREALKGDRESGSQGGGGSDQREGNGPTRHFGFPYRVWVPLAAAAVVAALVFFGPDRVPQGVESLGQVRQPPVYLGVPVRQEPASADSLFDAAMLLYVANDYSAAASLLRGAREAGADPVPSNFFLGACFLLLDRPEEAAETFGDVLQAGSSPYLAEAHYYRAKALLRLGEVEMALGDLRAAATSAGEISSAASSLADSLEALMGG